MKSITDKDVEKSTKIIGYKRLSSRKSPLGHMPSKKHIVKFENVIVFSFSFFYFSVQANGNGS